MKKHKSLIVRDITASIQLALIICSFSPLSDPKLVKLSSDKWEVLVFLHNTLEFIKEGHDRGCEGSLER